MSCAFLGAQMVRNPPAMQETQVQSLGQENPLEKGMAHTPVFLPGEFHGQRSLAGYSPWGRRELDTTEQLIMQKHLIVLYPSQKLFSWWVLLFIHLYA